MEETFMGKLEGKIAVITGGNSGLGLAAAERFVAEGAYVFIIGRRQAELDAAVKLIGRNVTAVQGEVGKLEDLDRLYHGRQRAERPSGYCVRQCRRWRLRSTGADYRGALRPYVQHGCERDAL